MGFVSFVFAYMEAVKNTIYAQLTDTLGTELNALMIDYQGVNIPFQYRMRLGKDHSACSSYQSVLIHYSQCTVTPKKLFSGLCSQLFLKTSAHWRYTKTKNIYCNAEVAYKPSITRVGEGEERTEAEECGG